MRRALAGRPSLPFEPPEEGIVFAAIDPDTGQLATPNCPKTIDEAFLEGTLPDRTCELHGGGFGSILSRLGGLFRRIVR
jgi:penicillin-binding protein 1B